MKSAVLIHGCHLQAEGWESIVWGDPKNGVLGRAPKGVRLALRERFDLIYWGTGASKKGDRKESEYTFDYTIAHAGQLSELEGFDPYEVESILRPMSYIDTVSQNTMEEVARAADVCRARGIGRLILVSSPTHIARCLQEAEKLRAAGHLGNLEVFATSSDTCFAGATPADVVIVEPPHRGDMPKWQTYRYVRAMFSVMKDKSAFERLLAEFGALLGRYGVSVGWKPLD